MDIDQLLNNAATAAENFSKANTQPKTADIWLTAAIHDAAQELADAGIHDQRMAAACTLAKLEALPEKTRAQQHTINILKEFLHD